MDAIDHRHDKLVRTLDPGSLEYALARVAQRLRIINQTGFYSCIANADLALSGKLDPKVAAERIVKATDHIRDPSLVMLRARVGEGA